MSNFIQKEPCPFCNQEADILHVDLNELGYSLECLNCGEMGLQDFWLEKLKQQQALKELQEEHDFGGYAEGLTLDETCEILKNIGEDDEN